MEELNELRNSIDLIDKSISKLLEERFEAARKIGEIKREIGIPVADSGREKTVLESAASCVRDEYKSCVENVFKTIISESKKLQI